MTREAEHTPYPGDEVSGYAQGHMDTPAKRWEATHARSAVDNGRSRNKRGDVLLLAVIAFVLVAGIAAFVFAILGWSAT